MNEELIKRLAREAGSTNDATLVLNAEGVRLLSGFAALVAEHCAKMLDEESIEDAASGTTADKMRAEFPMPPREPQTVDEAIEAAKALLADTQVPETWYTPWLSSRKSYVVGKYGEAYALSEFKGTAGLVQMIQNAYSTDVLSKV